MLFWGFLPALFRKQERKQESKKAGKQESKKASKKEKVLKFLKMIVFLFSLILGFFSFFLFILHDCQRGREIKK